VFFPAQSRRESILVVDFDRDRLVVVGTNDSATTAIAEVRLQAEPNRKRH